MGKTYRTILNIVLVVSIHLTGIAQEKPLSVLLLNRETLLKEHQQYQKNLQHATPMVVQLLSDAKSALDAKPVSVMQKSDVPPSGDKHDYMSLGPYWWPDTTKPNGLPYIRRDGEVNPEYRSSGDNERMGKMMNQVQALALAYCITEDEKYAEKASKHLQVWFLDEATKMNPNLNYGQAIKGVNQGRGIGIIETYQLRDLIDAFILLKHSPFWTREIDEGITGWFSDYLRWLIESGHGKDESVEKNNHGSAYDVQVSCIALYLGKPAIAKRILSEAGTKRIAVQIEPDGSQPLELARTKSWGYSVMNLDALIELALLGERVGIDLWNFQTKDGRSIRQAVNFLIPYALGVKKWTWRQIVPLNPDRMYYALRIAAEKFNSASYAKTAQAVWNRDVQSARKMFFIQPIHD
ncbi:MAG: alginate lyase family protein [bacterium]